MVRKRFSSYIHRHAEARPFLLEERMNFTQLHCISSFEEYIWPGFKSSALILAPKLNDWFCKSVQQPAATFIPTYVPKWEMSCFDSVAHYLSSWL